MAVRDVYTLPPDLPVPADDGAADHLRGAVVPSLALPATSGGVVDLAGLARPPAVLFFYPRTGQPGQSAGRDWDLIPGARGCTPQSCGFRDLHAEFRALGVSVAGVSTQTTEYQREFVAQPQRWKIERTFGWLDWSRVLSKEYERTTESSESDIYLASIRLMLRRLVNSAM